MTIDEAKQRIEAMQQYIEMIENYIPENYTQEVMKLYVELESVTKVAVILNDKGYKIGSRKVIGKDVSDLIRSKVTDDMHQMAKDLLKRNIKRSSGRGWG
ncbi:hypothetical protein [Sporosarcina obsidiansis]|uniref:hypothetical protein n=1 Tax=Sporosarcina obsidiansis TaxID=2660748 RepID=UPI00129B08DE|nr:hypothetical protein [Sporosarcina obsidiansis]